MQEDVRVDRALFQACHEVLQRVQCLADGHTDVFTMSHTINCLYDALARYYKGKGLQAGCGLNFCFGLYGLLLILFICISKYYEKS